MSRFTSKLQSQTVLLIGGTGGVGMSVATALLEFGANVILTSSRQPKLDKQLSSLRTQHPSSPPAAITGFVCDLASPDVETNLTTLVAAVRTHLSTNLHQPHLNHLIYLAGDALPVVPLAEVTLSKFHSATLVRGASCILSIKHCLPLLAPSHRSSITVTGGSISEKPIPGGWSMLAFIAAGLNGLARQLASDLAPLRVNAVAPGVIDTDLWAGMTQQERAEFYRSVETGLPTGRIASADDVAESYLYLLRDANVTGSTVHTNGGTFL